MEKKQIINDMNYVYNNFNLPEQIDKDIIIQRQDPADYKLPFFAEYVLTKDLYIELVDILAEIKDLRILDRICG